MKNRRRAILLLLSVLILFAGWRFWPDIRETLKRPAPVVTAPLELEEYTLVGKVVFLDEKRKLATIDHEAIAGWMPAMRMQFPVRDEAEWSKLRAGMSLKATVYVKDLDYFLGAVRETAEAATTPGRNP